MARRVGKGAIAQEDVVVHPEALVSTVGTAFGRMSQDPVVHAANRAREAVMAAAVTQCFAEGITDPEEIKARKAAALEALGG